jgi:hypothetical protein
MSQRLWTPTDWLRVAAGAVVGTAIAGAAWLSVSGSADINSQIHAAPWSVVGLVVVCGSLLSLITQGRRAVSERSRLLLGEPPVWSVAASSRSSASLVAGPGLKRYHRASCPIAHEQRWSSETREALEASGALPCGICEP